MRSYQSLLPDVKRALELFLDSQAPFRIIHTVFAYPHRPPTTSANFPPPPPIAPKTLLILDSSFNPPSRAHLSLATSAISTRSTSHTSPAQGGSEEQAKGDGSAQRRLLLLFSTHNADKIPAPAAFEHRLALMVLFAEDVADKLYSTEPSPSTFPTPESPKVTGNTLKAFASEEGIAVDVGLTSQPFYADKSTAIENTGAYPDSEHVHLAGTDTFVRILDPKYYASYNPPLSAMNGFFEKHALRVMVRDGDGMGLWEKLRKGELGGVGGKPAWAERIAMVPAEEQAVGVSSTRVRQAVDARDWEDVGAGCTPRVAEWIKQWDLYRS